MKTLGQLNYAVRQRMRFIDFLLNHYEIVNRSALVDFFGISIPQATKDFKTYMSLAPDNMRYWTSGKAYIKNPEFKKLF